MRNKLKKIEIVGAAIIENEKGEILLTQQPKWKNKWLFPGGHVEAGESIIKGILREVKEEVGLKINPKGVKIVAFGELINSKEFYCPAHFIYFDIFCKVKKQKVKLDKVESKKYVWVLPQGALKMNLEKSSRQSLKIIKDL